MLEDVETELTFLDTGSGVEDGVDSDCTLVIFSVTDQSSLRGARSRLEKMVLTGETDRALILVGNKVDLVRTRTVSITGGSFIKINMLYDNQFNRM